MEKRIVITGATGLIGSKLVELLKKWYTIRILTRNPDRYTNTREVHYVAWDGKSAITDIIDGCFAVVNLAGENIGAKKWTDEEKKRILDSRVNAARAIKNAIENAKIKPQVWVQASATGYYQQATGELLTEESPMASNSFLAKVCDQWEAPINELVLPEVRKVIVRTGVVLAKNSDLWKQLTMSFKFGVAAIPGSGKQHLPWIHIDDEVNAIFQLIIKDKYNGIFNLAAPTPATMEEIVKAISTKKRSLFSIKIPRWFLEFLFGKEKTDEIILTDQQVSPTHLLNSEFEFTYKKIADAVTDLASKY